MKSSTNENNKVAQPTVDFRKIPYDKGSEWTTEWFEDFARFVRMIPENLLKKQMVSVLDKGVNYTPKFRTLDEVMTDYDITDLEQGKVVENALSKAVSQETINLPLVRSQSHAIIVHLLEECAKAVASADPIFRMNDELANPDPVATVLALKRILIAEREGNGSVRKMTSKAEAIADFLAIRKNSTSNENEGLTDFRDRFVRKQKGLKDNYGYEILGNTFADEREMVLFFTHRLDSKYVQLQRDIKNKIVPAPLTLDEAVLMAKDRVEVTKKALETVAPVSIFTTAVRDIPATNPETKTLGPSTKNISGHVKRADHKRGFQMLGPLVPYPRMSHLEYSGLTDYQKVHVKEHNQAIQKAAATMGKNVSNSREGRATLATITNEPEALDVGYVMMSYDIPQEPEQTIPVEYPGEAVLPRRETEHHSAPKRAKGPRSAPQIQERAVIYNTLPTSDGEHHDDRSLLSTYARGGGTIPTDADEYRTLLAWLRSVPSTLERVHTRGAIHTRQSPPEFSQYPSVVEEIRANNRGVYDITPPDPATGADNNGERYGQSIETPAPTRHHRTMADHMDDTSYPNTPDDDEIPAPTSGDLETSGIQQPPTPQTDVGSDDERVYQQVLASNTTTELQRMHADQHYDMAARRSPPYSEHVPSRLRSQKALTKGIHPEPSASNTPSRLLPDDTTVHGIPHDNVHWTNPSVDTPPWPYVTTPTHNMWPAKLEHCDSHQHYPRSDDSDSERKEVPPPPLPFFQSEQSPHQQPIPWNQSGLHPRQQLRHDHDDYNDPWAQSDTSIPNTPKTTNSNSARK
jgi:hypothetical protein